MRHQSDHRGQEGMTITMQRTIKLMYHQSDRHSRGGHNYAANNKTNVSPDTLSNIRETG